MLVGSQERVKAIVHLMPIAMTVTQSQIAIQDSNEEQYESAKDS